MDDLLLELGTKLLDYLALALGGVVGGFVIPVLEGALQELAQRWKENQAMVNAGAAQQRATTDQALASTAKEAKELGDAVDTAGAVAVDAELAGWSKPG